MNDSKSEKTKIEEAHRKAVELGADFYLDPRTGYQVLTEDFLKRRGSCCKSGCRHCPYGFRRGPSGNRE